MALNTITYLLTDVCFNFVSGTYFTILLCMVCTSVMVTVAVFRIGVNTCAMPVWVEKVFIDFLGKCVGLAVEKDQSDKYTPTVSDKYTSTVSDKYIPTVVKENGYYDNHASDFESLEAVLATINGRDPTCLGKGIESPNINRNPSQTINVEGNVYYLAKIHHLLEDYKREEKLSRELPMKWQRLAAILDRSIFYFVAILTFMTTATMILEIQFGAEEDFSEQVQTWFGDNTDAFVEY